MRHRSVVIALGGNALLRKGDHGTDQEQSRNAESPARVVAELARRGWSVVVVHGNGPQVGNLLIQMEEAALKVPPSSLDVAVAMSQGSMGYILSRAIQDGLDRRGVEREVVTLVTRVEVDDVTDLKPTKPVGPFFSRYRARDLMKKSGWEMVEDSGRGWRKVVPSPRPLKIAGTAAIRDLLRAGHVVIAGGGGGVPVRRGKGGKTRGIEAVIDKDLTAALLGNAVGASLLVNVTGIGNVYRNYGRADQEAIDLIAASELAQLLADGAFAEGSMAPKIESMLSFLKGGGREAVVTDGANLRRALAGRSGTRVYRDRIG